MSDIEQKALALVNEARAEALQRPLDRMTLATSNDIFLAFYYTVGQHEATKQELSDFKQEVSDTIQAMLAKDGAIIRDYLGQFIIPAPKPDPLVEAMADCGVDRFESWADQLRAALDARGFEIRNKNDD